VHAEVLDKLACNHASCGKYVFKKHRTINQVHEREEIGSFC